jgi:hypothetical protein
MMKVGYKDYIDKENRECEQSGKRRQVEDFVQVSLGCVFFGGVHVFYDL